MTFTIAKLGVVLLGAAIVSASVIRVPGDFPTIQAAIDIAQLRDTVLLDSGRYQESVLVPSRDLTISSRFLLTGDTSDITNCNWQGINNGDDTLRCLSSDEIPGDNPFVRIVGIRFVKGGCRRDDEGGAIRIVQQFARIENCSFDSCYGGYGGAIAIDQATSSIRNCSFTHCGQLRLASILRVKAARAMMDSCIVQSDTSYEDIFEPPVLFWVKASKLTIRNSIFRDVGFYPYEWGGTFIYGSKPPDSVEFIGCQVFDNHIEVMIADGGRPINYLRIDSCHFYDNMLTQDLYDQSAFDSLTEFQAIGNVFESFFPYARAQMHGLVALDVSDHHITRMQHNLVQDIHGGHTSFGTIAGDNEDLRIVSGNYILGNSNRSITSPPSGQIQGINGPGVGELEYNVFMGNLGYAVYQGSGQEQGFAQHNYWGHESGPHDPVRNPDGQGDTVSSRILYEPWEIDTSFFNAAPEPREPVEVPQSFIGNAYPNPFNSNVTIEFVLLKDQEITLDIFDLMGRHVETVLSGRMNKGVHIRDWHPESQASGIYFARLVGEKNLNSTVKLLLLK
ncbi:MAG: T9SS type A sorting domain-containing protein [bacterium]|nr:T9SS type A sorting domain-containing protein [bacterium]